jgi:hypothetical protein
VLRITPQAQISNYRADFLLAMLWQIRQQFKKHWVSASGTFGRETTIPGSIR